MIDFEKNNFLKILYFGIKYIFLLRPISYFNLYKEFFRISKKKQLIYKLWNGTQFLIRTGTSDILTLGEIYIRKIYEDKKIKENSTIIDLGAHIGFFSVWYAKKSNNIRVYSYEPSEENFKLLQKNIKINKLEKNVNAFKFAVSGKKGFVKFFLTGNEATNTLYGDPKKTKIVKVKSTTLKEIFKVNNIKTCDLLKVDIEGAEYELFRRTPKEILNKIKIINIEYHNGYEELKQILENNGFVVTVKPAKYSSYTSSYIYAKK
ncbi:MAG: FkbM family methyltransferase [Candidatus Aenigmarchaeota archaeon]|nr:FkbM family methyltransferase [Candidatus Aenigmarchaeota archaeon]